MGKPNVIVNDGRCIHRGKKRFMPGDKFEAGAKEKERLLSKGAVKAVEEMKQDPFSGDDIINAVKKVIENGDVTADNKPKTEAIEKILGRRVSAEERDAALEIINDGEGSE